MVRKLRRKIVRVLLILLVVVIALVAAAPWLANTGPVRRFVAAEIRAALGREVTLESVEAGWGSGVVLKGLVVANRRREFRGQALLEADEIHLDQPLHQLVFGGGEMRVRVRGLKLRIAEQGGGRTNLDDIVARLAAPRPRGPAREPVEPKPIDIELVQSSVEVRHLPRRPRGFDPYTEDPVILPANEGALIIALSRIRVAVSMGRDGARLAARGTVSVNGRGGEVEVDVSAAAGAWEGSVIARGLDLAITRPFLAVDLAGRLDLEAKAHEGRYTLSARIEDLETPRLNESWITLDARLAQHQAGVQVEHLELATASGEVALTGHGDFADAGRAVFSLSGHAPRRLLAPGGAGVARVAWEGDIQGSLIRWKGTTRIEGVPETGDLTLTSDLELDTSTRTLKIRELTAKAERIHATLRGRAVLMLPPTFDLDGSVDADLARLRALLDGHLALDPETAVAGRLRVTEGRVSRSADGDLAVRVRGGVTELVYQDVRREVVSFDIDAQLDERGDRLTVRRGLIDDLEVQGHVAGLREKRIRDGRGSIKGSIRLDAALARLAGLKRLSGTAQVDLTAGMSPDGFSVGGTVAVEGLRVNEIERRRVAMNGTMTFARHTWTGRGRVEADQVAGTFKVLDLTQTRVNATLALDAVGVAELAAVIPGLALPKDLELAGTLQPVLSIRRGENWNLRVFVPEARLTARQGEYGPQDEIFSADLTATRAAGPRWSCGGRLQLGTMRLQPILVHLDEEGRVRGQATIKGLVEGLARLAPEARRLAPTGLVDFNAIFGQGADGDWHFDLKGGGPHVTFTVDQKRVGPRRLHIEAMADSTGRIPMAVLEIGGAKLTAKGKLEKLHVVVTADARDLPMLPELKGKGWRIEADVTWNPNGAFAANGTARARSIANKETSASGLVAEFDMNGIRENGRLSRIGGSLHAKAKRAKHGAIQLTDLDVSTVGSGDPRTAVYFRSDIRVKRVDFDGGQVHEVVSSQSGSWHEKMRAPNLEGPVTFERLKTDTATATNGRADLRLDNLVLRLDKVAAAIEGGTLAGDGEIDLGRTPGRWRCDLSLKDVRIDGGLNTPLAMLLPFLYLSGQDHGKVSGRVSGNVSLSGRGTSEAALTRSLVGKGGVHFHETEVTGSLLLPLLTFRLDRALRNQPFRFRDVDVNFSASGGRIRTRPFKLIGTPYDLSMSGSVGLDGTIDYRVRLSAFSLPLRIRGTLKRPRVKLSPEDLLR